MSNLTTNNSFLQPSKNVLAWWEEEHTTYLFSHVAVKTKMELINGSGITRLTDRQFMMQLAINIQKFHECEQQKRIEERKKEESLHWFGRVI